MTQEGHCTAVTYGMDKAAVLLVRTRQQALANEKEKARKKSQEASEVVLNVECDSPEDNTEECSEIEVDSNPNSARQKTSSQKRKDWQQYALTLLERQPLDESAEQLQLKQKEDATLVDLWREAEAGGGVRRGCYGIRMWTGWAN